MCFFYAEGVACAVRLRKKHNTCHIIKYSSLKVSEEELAGAFFQLYQELNVSSNDIKIFAGYFANRIIFDCKLPHVSHKEIDAMLEFEISRRIPVEDKAIVKLWRIINVDSKENESKSLIVRVCLIEKNFWNSFLDEIAKSGIKSDLIVVPELIADPIFNDIDLLFPASEESFIWKMLEDRTREPVFLAQTEKKAANEELKRDLAGKIHNFYGSVCEDGLYQAALLCSLYAASKASLQDKQLRSVVPKKIRADRFLGFKISSLLIYSLVIIVAIFYMLDDRQRVESQKHSGIVEKQDLQKEYVKIAELNAKYKNLSARISRIDKIKARYLKLLPVFGYIGEKFPKYCWFDGMRQNGNVITTTAIAFTNTDQIMGDLSLIDKVEAKSLTKHAGRNGSVRVNLRLNWLKSKAKNNSSRGGSGSAGSSGDAPERVDLSSIGDTVEDIQAVVENREMVRNILYHASRDKGYANEVRHKLKNIPGGTKRFNKMLGRYSSRHKR